MRKKMGGLGKVLLNKKCGRYSLKVHRERYSFGRGWIIWKGRYSTSLEIWLGPVVVYLIRER